MRSADPDHADYVVVFDGYNKPVPANRTIYVGQHPNVGHRLSPAFRTFEDKQCLGRVRLDKHFNPGEVWIDYDYDFLSTLDPPSKTKKLACVMTYQTHNTMYAQRVKFMRDFVTKGGQCDLYGRPSEKFEADTVLRPLYKGSLGQNKPDGRLNQHTIGKNLLIDYEYSLEFDVGPTQNYLSERFYDSMLLWCYPLYFGSTNVAAILPSQSFFNLDIHQPVDMKAIDAVLHDYRRCTWHKER